MSEQVKQNISENLLLVILYAASSDLISRCESACQMPDLQPEEREILASLTLLFTDSVKEIAQNISDKQAEEKKAQDEINEHIHNLIRTKN